MNSKENYTEVVANVNILEGIRFYVSFACSFAFGENKTMEGSSKIIALIARDENQHLALTQNILNKWHGLVMIQTWLKLPKRKKKMSSLCLRMQSVKRRSGSQYLFKDGSMIGLNDKLLMQYVEWIANRRMKALGLKPIFDIPAKNNPLPWTEHWISSKGLQVAPQETEVESYIVGGIKQDMKKNVFGFQL